MKPTLSRFSPSRALVLVSLVVSGVVMSGHGVRAETWAALSEPYGVGAIICEPSDVNISCFTLRCGRGRGIEFAYLSTTGDFIERQLVPTFVDGDPLTTLSLDVVEPATDLNEIAAAYDPDKHGDFIRRLKTGSRLNLHFENKLLDFDLDGADSEISRTLDVCAADAGSGLVGGAIEVNEATRQALIDQVVAGQLDATCGANGGEIDPASVVVADLTGDGRDDIVVDHAGLRCADRARSTCGNSGCNLVIFVRDGDRFRQLPDLVFGRQMRITEGKPAVVSLIMGIGSDSRRFSLAWNGTEFMSEPDEPVAADSKAPPPAAFEVEAESRWKGGPVTSSDPSRGAFAGLNYARMAHNAISLSCKPGSNDITIFIDIEPGGDDEANSITVDFIVDERTFSVSGRREFNELEGSHPILIVKRRHKLIDALRAGSRLEIRTEGAHSAYHLQGSSAAIRAMLRACPKPKKVAASKKEKAIRFETIGAAVAHEIAEGCNGRGGNIEPWGLVEHDLNGDGQADVLISHDAVRCDGQGFRSGYCGAQACSVNVYLGDHGGLAQSFGFLSLGFEVGDGQVPVIRSTAHGGSKARLRWNGTTFAFLE